MNTAARVESTGAPGKIHLSESTAEELKKLGKGHWTTARADAVAAKGKGTMKTHWLTHVTNRSDTTSSVGTGLNAPTSSTTTEVVALNEANGVTRINSKTKRLIDWNCDVLERLLKMIVARRNAGEANSGTKDWEDKGSTTGNPLEEVKEIIELPKFDSKAAKNQQSPQSIVLGQAVQTQLKDYVTTIALMYHANPFHCYEHASHVAMSVVKLLSRIVAPMDMEETNKNVSDTCDKKSHAKTLHDHTYGITSDPLTQFACVFAALIHDVDHQGIPNDQLIKENFKIAAVYENRRYVLECPAIAHFTIFASELHFLTIFFLIDYVYFNFCISQCCRTELTGPGLGTSHGTRIF